MSHPTRQHVCLSYSGVAEFVVRARQFLTEGLADGLRVQLVVGDDGAALLDRLGALDADRPDAVQVRTAAQTYRAGTAPVEPAAQVEAYAAATEDAVADGFAGLRVAADATTLVRTPDQFDAFARYEHQVDRYMLDHPFSALCGYDRGELGQERLARLASLHPQVRPEATTPVRVFAAPGASVAVAGEIDMAGRRLFFDALDRAGVWAGAGSEVVLEAGGLRFADHHSLLRLAEEAERRGATVVLRTRWTGAARVVDVLGVTGLRVEPAR